LHRFFVKQDNIKDSTDGEEIVLCGDNAAHANVLRLRRGEEIAVAVLDGGNLDYYCIITQISRDEIHARIADKLPNEAELPVSITLFQALPKGDKMGDIIEHVTELGVNEIIPIVTERCVARPSDSGDKTAHKINRWQKIAESAAKLCHRGRIPQIGGLMDFKEAVQLAVKDFDVAFVCYELEKERHVVPFLKGLDLDLDKPSKIAFFIGPEGGFAADEIECFKESGITAVSLGNRILRTQSAAALVMGYVNFILWG